MDSNEIGDRHDSTGVTLKMELAIYTRYFWPIVGRVQTSLAIRALGEKALKRMA